MKFRIVSLNFFRMYRLSLFTFLFLVLGGAPLWGDQSATQQPADNNSNLVIKKTVRRVVLDMVVTDQYGRALHGLTPKDFVVKEDGVPQQILSFDVHTLDAGSDFAKLPPLPPNTFINIPSVPEHGPLYVLLLDLVNTETGDEAYARKELLKFISSKPEGTRFAVFLLAYDLHLVQGFTDDKKVLYDVLNPSNSKSPIPAIFSMQEDLGRGNVGKMVHVITSITQYLNGLSGRKNLIWVAGDFPMQLFPTDGNTAAYRDEVKGALESLTETQTAIYPVDIRGVPIDNAHAPAASTGGGGLDADYRSNSNNGEQPANSTAQEAPHPQPPGDYHPNVGQAAGNQGYSLLAHSYMIEDEIAGMTGGRAFYSDNGLSAALTEAVEDGADYYTLTYSPSNSKYDGTLRKIKVELSQKGYRLSYRRTYYSVDPDAVPAQDNTIQANSEPATRKQDDSLFANMRHGAPLAHKLYFRAHIHTEGVPTLATAEQMANLQDQPAYFHARSKNHAAKMMSPIKLQTYLVDYTIMTQDKSNDTQAPALEIAAAAYDDQGKMLNGVVENTQTGTGKSAANNKGIYRAQQEIDAPLNATSIRVAVRDMNTDRVGAMEINLPLQPEQPNPAISSNRPEELKGKQ